MIDCSPPRITINTNHINYQAMQPTEKAGPWYCLPYLLNRDAGGRPFENLLISGQVRETT
jgi:hypothetical protein